MKFLNLVVENFGAIQCANIRLDGQGLVLIQGENKDDSSAISNGAGKSTIPDALCWALYDRTARGDSGDKVINRTAKRDCAVTVNITDGDHSWSIARHRKHSLEKNRVVVKQINIATGAITDLTQGTDKATQEVIDKILGCTAEVFMASICAGQEMMPNLPGMTDKQLKELIEQAAGIDRLQRAYDLARAEARETEAMLETRATNLRFCVRSLERTEQQIKELDAAYVEYEAKASEKITELSLKLKEFKLEKEKLEMELHTSFEPKLDSMYQATIDALGAVEGERAKLASHETTLVARERDLTKAQTLLDMAVQAAKKKRSEFDNVDSVMGKPCSTCGKPHTSEEREDLRKHIGEQLKVAIEDVKRLKTHVGAAMVSRDEAARAIEVFKTGMMDTSQLTEELSKLKASMDERERVRRRAGSVEQSAREIDRQIGQIAETVNPHKSQLESCKSALKGALSEVEECKKRVAEGEEAVQLAKMAVEVFGPAGVRAHILDTVTPFLNAKTAEYLNALSDGNLTAIWTTLGKTAKGEIREKFNIEVSSTTAGEGFGSLSGGEKRKVRLACAMALQDLVASRATKPIDLFIGDEIDHALDPAGLERLMGVLEQKAKERGTVLVISHGDLTDWIRQVMVVTKRGGYSTVSGALVI